MASQQPSGSEEWRKPGPFRALMLWFTGFLIFLVASVFIVRLIANWDVNYFSRYVGGYFATAASSEGENGEQMIDSVELTQPRLQVDEPLDFKHYRAAEEAHLNSFGWADQGSGRARISIDTAMELLVEKGLPFRRGGSE